MKMRCGAILLFFVLCSITQGAEKRLLVDEVQDSSSGEREPDETFDDYESFNGKPIKNRVVNTKLKQVTYEPILPTFSTPRPARRPISTTVGRVKATTASPPPGLRRRGYYYQHYPYDRLHHFYRLNPHLQYYYPAEYEKYQWYYRLEQAPYFQDRQYYDLVALGYYREQ